MSGKAEKLQDAIGLISDEYIVEAHGEAETEREMLGEQEQEQAQAQEARTGGQAASNVVPLPQQRKRRRATAPIAIAASLVLALGVGALAFSLSTPSAKDVVETAKTDERAESAEPEAMMMTSESYADGATAAEAGAGGTDAYNYTPGSPDFQRPSGEAFVLTAGEWNDNDSWPFFMNLVNSNTIRFPVFGLDPTHRVKVTVEDASGNPLRGEDVVLLSPAEDELWRGVSGKDGAAYLFYREGQTPASVKVGGVQQFLEVVEYDSAGQQGTSSSQIVEELTVTVRAQAGKAAGLQVMFIVDTTGSMSDEIAYLQKDFASIAGDVGSEGISYSVNFYRDKGDEYVTKCNPFTSNVGKVQSLLNDEYADGGGDAPEAVADILAETITENGDWRDDCNKVAFLIFDAPPHDGTDAVVEEAVRSAAERGIKLVPVVASNADRETELFGRALAIMTDGTYVFLTDDSGVGNSHLEPIIGDYKVELLHDVIVRIIEDNR